MVKPNLCLTSNLFLPFCLPGGSSAESPNLWRMALLCLRTMVPAQSFMLLAVYLEWCRSRNSDNHSTEMHIAGSSNRSDLTGRSAQRAARARRQEGTEGGRGDMSRGQHSRGTQPVPNTTLLQSALMSGYILRTMAVVAVWCVTGSSWCVWNAAVTSPPPQSASS